MRKGDKMKRKMSYHEKKQREIARIGKHGFLLKTPIREHYYGDCDWRIILQDAVKMGYKVPLSACRDLWHGKRETCFDGCIVSDLFFNIN